MKSLLRRCWLAVRKILESVVPRRYVDRVLERLGFFRFKARFLRERRRLPDGIEIVFRPDDEKVIREIYDEGAYDHGTIKDGDTVVDVGGNIGVFALKAARQTPRGRVVCVEPAPLNLELLRQNLASNRIANAVVVDCALSDHEGQAPLFERGDYGLYSLRMKSEVSDLSTSVRLSTLDRLFREQGIGACALLKIDVEGAELDVLRGGAEALRVTAQVMMEVTKIDEHPRQCRELLTQAGFECREHDETSGGVLLYARRL